MAFTKVVGPGIHTLSNITRHNVHSSGIITATRFDGPFTNLNVTGVTTFGGSVSIAGTLTYDESKVFTCSETSPNDCNPMITQLNIPFQPQVVGATGLAIDGVMDTSKAGFTA